MAAAIQERTGSSRDALASIRVIDVDTHLSEPYDLWTARAPAKWKEWVPRVREINGIRQWVIDANTLMHYASPSSVVRTDGEKSAESSS